MNGISLALSKSCCPMYNIGRSNKINFGSIDFGTSKKMDLIPCRLSSLHLPRVSPPVAIKPMLKHRVYSGTNDVFEAPEVSATVVPYGLLGFLGIFGLALLKAREAVALTNGGIEGVLKLNARNYILLGVAGVFVARGFLGKIICGFAVLLHKPFSPGDFIQVGYLYGKVIKMGLMTTSLVTDDDRRIDVPTYWFYGQIVRNRSRGSTLVPYSLLCGEVSVNKPRPSYHEWYTMIYLEKEFDDKLFDIIHELRENLASNSNVYLKEGLPFVAVNELGTYGVLEIACHQQMSKEELHLAKQDVLLEVTKAIRKQGVKLGGYKVK